MLIDNFYIDIERVDLAELIDCKIVIFIGGMKYDNKYDSISEAKRVFKKMFGGETKKTSSKKSIKKTGKT